MSAFLSLASRFSVEGVVIIVGVMIVVVSALWAFYLYNQWRCSADGGDA